MKANNCLLALIVCFGGFSIAVTAFASDQSPLGVDNPTLGDVEHLLKKVGAQPPELAKLEGDLSRDSAEDVAEFKRYLEGLSPDKLAAYVEDLRRNAQYRIGADSKPQAGVPSGTILELTLDHSKIYPGTTRKITVYVPAQYTEDKPACVYVGFDGLAFGVPTVFDNLIFKREMPITIAVGIAPGVVPSADPPRDPRFNRSLEFDSLNGDLGRFVLEEVLPEVERHKTPDGRAIHLSKDPNDRAAGGGSTGGIAAFGLAWEHPDAFRRVFSAVGTYVGMRGGDHYAVLVRKTEPKPIRIYVQDGSRDEMTDFLGEVGDWWLSNQTMVSALEFAGYDVKHIFGEGSHEGSHASAIFPDAMGFMWKDWPAPITAGHSKNVMLRLISEAGDGWQITKEPETGAPALEMRPSGQETTDWRGRRYRTDTAAGRVWLDLPNGNHKLLDSGLAEPTGVAESPDGLWLSVAERKSHWGYSYRIRPDGTADARERFYWFHVPDRADSSGAANWLFDREGHLYAATLLGVQVFDRNGRSRAILPLPDSSPAIAVGFGGNDFDTLYVRSANHHVYQRRVKIKGLPPRAPPIALPPVSPG